MGPGSHVYEVVRIQYASATAQVRVTEILWVGCPRHRTDPITWDTNRFNTVGTIRGVTSPGANIVLVSSVLLAPLCR